MTAAISNVGGRDGAEVVQLYVAPRTGGAFRPVKELKGFAKVHLKPGETREVSFRLDRRSFSVWDPAGRDWVVEAGEYVLEVGSSSADIRLAASVTLEGAPPVRTLCSDWYHTLKGVPSEADFLTIHPGYPKYVARRKGQYDLNSSINELKESSLLFKLLYKVLERLLARENGGRADYENPSFKMMMNSTAANPIRALVLFSPDRMPLWLAEALVEWANGRRLRALWRMMRRR